MGPGLHQEEVESSAGNADTERVYQARLGGDLPGRAEAVVGQAWDVKGLAEGGLLAFTFRAKPL